MPTLAIEAVGLAKTYRGKDGEVEAVRGVDLGVSSGEVFGFLGPNGAGKSTTVRMLTTLMTITGGTARVAGLDVAADPNGVRRRIGVALQEAGLDPRQTARETLVLQCRLFRDGQGAGRLPGRRAPRARGAHRGGGPQRQGLLGRHEAPARSRHRARPPPRRALPRRAHHRARSGLSAHGVGGVRRINEQGTTVFLTTQYLEEADALCNRLAIIDAGRIVREGTPSSLKADLRQREGLSQDPTLDDVFLDATGRKRERVAGSVQEVR